MLADIQEFRLPRYSEIPNVGLFLEQTVKYINSFLEPLGCMEITASMVSNYVKKHYIAPPVKKQYYADQIAYLFFIVVTKNILSMENIGTLFEMQKQTFTIKESYDYFCDTLEQRLRMVFGRGDCLELKILDESVSEERRILECVISSAASVIYLSDCLDRRKEEAVSDNQE